MTESYVNVSQKGEDASVAKVRPVCSGVTGRLSWAELWDHWSFIHLENWQPVSQTWNTAQTTESWAYFELLIERFSFISEWGHRAWIQGVLAWRHAPRRVLQILEVCHVTTLIANYKKTQGHAPGFRPIESGRSCSAWGSLQPFGGHGCAVLGLAGLCGYGLYEGNNNANEGWS